LTLLPPTFYANFKTGLNPAGLLPFFHFRLAKNGQFENYMIEIQQNNYFDSVSATLTVISGNQLSFQNLTPAAGEKAEKPSRAGWLFCCMPLLE